MNLFPMETGLYVPAVISFLGAAMCVTSFEIQRQGTSRFVAISLALEHFASTVPFLPRKHSRSFIKVKRYSSYQYYEYETSSSGLGATFLSASRGVRSDENNEGSFDFESMSLFQKLIVNRFI